MTERGGSTTQSGIYFQNAVAARYLRRMLHPRLRPLNAQEMESGQELACLSAEKISAFGLSEDGE